jgi:hypothetical protein
MVQGRPTGRDIAAQALSAATKFLEDNYPCECGSDPDCGGEAHEAGLLIAMLWPILRQPSAPAVTPPIALPVPRRGAEAMTAGELIHALVKVDPVAVVSRTSYDVDDDFVAVYGIASVNADGVFHDSRILNSWFGPEPVEDNTYLEGTTP